MISSLERDDRLPADFAPRHRHDAPQRRAGGAAHRRPPRPDARLRGKIELQRRDVDLRAGARARRPDLLRRRAGRRAAATSRPSSRPRPPPVGRRAAPDPGLLEPAQQRRQVHPRGRHDHGALAATSPPGRGSAVEVTDTGMGIEPDVLPRIFDAFEQGEPARDPPLRRPGAGPRDQPRRSSSCTAAPSRSERRAGTGARRSPSGCPAVAAQAAVPQPRPRRPRGAAARQPAAHPPGRGPRRHRRRHGRPAARASATRSRSPAASPQALAAAARPASDGSTS